MNQTAIKSQLLELIQTHPQLVMDLLNKNSSLSQDMADGIGGNFDDINWNVTSTWNSKILKSTSLKSTNHDFQ